MPQLTYKSLYSYVIKEIDSRNNYSTSSKYSDQLARASVSPVSGSERGDASIAELIRAIQNLLDDAIVPTIIEGLVVEATTPISNQVTVSAGKGSAGGKLYELSNNITLTIPLESSVYIYYIVLYRDSILVEKTYSSNKLTIAKIVVPNPGITSLIQDTKDSSWNAYIVNFSEYKLYGYNDRFEEDTIELLRNNINPILADNLIGNIRLSEDLKITNTQGTLELDSSSLKLYDVDENLLSKFNRQGVYFYNTSGIEMARFTNIDARIGNILVTSNSIESDNFLSGSVGFQIKDDGNVEFNNMLIRGTIYALAGEIGGWTIASDSLYATTTGTIKTSETAGSGSNGVVIDKDGLRVYDDILGNVVNLPSDGSAPTFSSGIINSTTFEIQTNSVIRTSEYVGGSDGYTVLLIHGDGVNGASVFTDVCGNVVTPYSDDRVKLLMHLYEVDSGLNFIDEMNNYITNYGVTFDEDNYKFKDGSALFDGSSYLMVNTSNNWNINEDQFSIDLWVKFSDVSGDQVLISQYKDANNYWCFKKTSDHRISFVAYQEGVSLNDSKTGVLTINNDVWYKFSVGIINGIRAYYHLNGIMYNDFYFPNLVMPIAFDSPLYIGSLGGVSNFVKGNMNELRFLKGLSVDNLFLDSLLSIEPYSIFPTTTTEKRKLGTSSISLGGYLSIPASNDWYVGEGDFSIDFWVNFSGTIGYTALIGQYNWINDQRSWLFVYANGYLYFLYSLDGTDTTAHTISRIWDVTAGEWYHVALTREDGILRFFINGSQLGDSETVVDNFFRGISPITIGCVNIGLLSSPIYSFYGYMDEIRISKGIARWTENFTPPTTSYKSFDSGLLMNNTGLYGCAVGQSLADANFKILASGDAYFKGEIRADSGTIGNVTINSSGLYGGLIEGALIRAPIIESSATYPKIRMDSEGFYYTLSSGTGAYDSFNYGEGTYGSSTLAYLFNTHFPILSIEAETNYADIHLFNRSEDPGSGTGPFRVGDLICVNGELKIYNESGNFTEIGGSTVNSKSFVLSNPTSSSDGPIWRTSVAITITAIHVLCVDGTNIVGQLDELDSNGLNAVAVDDDITGTAGTNVNDDGLLTNPGIDAGDYVGWHTTSVSGSVTKVIVTFEYTLA